MKTPLVSVVLPVRNGLPYLQQAIASLQAQSLTDYECICIDDGSTDGSAELLAAVRDPRWRVIRQRKPLGLAATLNKGLRLARGAYWARMDADDISLPRRLELQAAYLDTHPQVSLVGAWAKTLGQSKEQVWRLPQTPQATRAEMLFNSAFVHSAVMLRHKDFLAQRLRYNPKIARAQDYELWERAANTLQLANIPKVLLRYRIHPAQVGQQHGAAQAHTAAIVRARQLRRLKLGASPRELALHNQISTWQFATHSAFLRRVEAWLSAIARANAHTSIYDPAALQATLEQRWWAACRAAAVHNAEAWRIYTSSALARAGRRNALEKTIFWAKATWPR